MQKFDPYIHTEKKIPEFTIKATVLGVILGLFFAIANAYLGLKTGTTVSASIPAAIISMAILRLFFKNVTILENNIVQTIATVGEGLAAGIVFTIPALIFLGYTPSLSRIFLLSILGGLLGILFMIPMRRYIIVQEHGKLPFPEGTACAEILKTGEKKLSTVILGLVAFFISVIYKIGSNIFYLWDELPKWTINSFKKTEFSMDATPALLGIGYLIGPKMAATTFAGSLLSWGVIIPLIRMFAEGSSSIIQNGMPIAQMTAHDLWVHYVRYIGAGAVATGGIISMIKVFPVVFKAIHIGIKELFNLSSAKQYNRTDTDISMSWLIIGSIAIITTIWLIPSMNFFTVILLTIMGFLFVAITSFTVGIIGSSSNPSSGMTMTTLLITCIIFVSLGWTEKIYLIAAITMGCVTNIAITMAATTSQDLKTGFLLGATPKYQQIAEIVGILIPSLALGITIYLLNAAYHLGSSNMPAPQATLMAMVAQGVINGDLPFTLVFIGVILGIIFWLTRIPLLPFAMGIYLPLSLTSAIMVGGLLSAFVSYKSASEITRQKGILVASGLIGGDACMGILIAILTISGIIPADKAAILPQYTSLIFYFGLATLLYWLITRKKHTHPDAVTLTRPKLPGM
jgi:putative OPT family oligopeptide transporter